ncbi:MAG: hypothetical protein Q4E47_00540 [Candidatus Saccharibacteria bacterium]|nr:hypothetical protein [Candidatus Saccharibacteria bacterium]
MKRFSDVEKVLRTKKLHGTFNHLAISPDMYDSPEEQKIISPKFGRWQKEYNYKAMQLAKEFEEGDDETLDLSALLPGRTFCALGQLCQEYIKYTPDSGKHKGGVLSWWAGDIIKTSPIVRIHRTENCHTIHGECFLIETQHSCYLIEHLYMTEESKKLRKKIFEECPKEANATMPRDMYCDLVEVGNY